jgi:hypothetical protein
MPQRHSRHYYDLYKLAVSPLRAAAIAQFGLLEEVVEFTQRFYPSAWARYDLAVPGTFKLLPPEGHFTALERDYAAMQVMLFGNPPELGSILEELRSLETEINSLGL